MKSVFNLHKAYPRDFMPFETSFIANAGTFFAWHVDQALTYNELIYGGPKVWYFLKGQT